MCVCLSIYKSNQIRVLTKLLVIKHYTELSELTRSSSFHQIATHFARKKNTADAASLRTRANALLDEQAPAKVSKYYTKKNEELLSTIGPGANVLRKEHEWIFSMQTGLLKQKLKYIKEMNFTAVEHSLPFFKLSPMVLLNIWKSVKSDEENNLCKNRLYYLCDRLKCDPAKLSLKLSTRTFIYTLSFDWFEKSLNVLLEMGVPPERIVKDLWVIKYNHETIKKRLESVKASGLEDLTPWMVRCPEETLDRTIQISQTTKDMLGEYSTVHAYLANRLNTTPDVISVMYYKIPAIKTIRIMKAKSCLDYIFAEGFTEEDVINVPRIFAHSLKTIKYRLDKLRAVGISTRNLNVLCKTTKKFNTFYESLTSHLPKVGHKQEDGISSEVIHETK